MKFKLDEGIIKKDSEFEINMLSDTEADIIATTETDIYTSNFKDNVYYFGYKFKPECPSTTRSAFIKWLKAKTFDNITPELESFIIKPLKVLYKEKLNNNNIDAIIAPRSNRSELVRIIKSILTDIMPRDTARCNIELVKNLPQKILFDWEEFNYNYTGEIGDYRYSQIYSYIENEVMPKIHSLDYFSLAQNVKFKYRKYIQNYLTFESNTDEKLFKAIKNGNILIIDDIATSGSTLNEILKVINAINSDCNIYIFTLIGK